MRVGHGGRSATNVQIVVDHKHKLVVEHEVTNEVTDQGQLSCMAKKAQETLGVQTLEVVADRGYYNGEEVKACEESGMTVYVPKPNNSSTLFQSLVAIVQLFSRGTPVTVLLWLINKVLFGKQSALKVR